MSADGHTLTVLIPLTLKPRGGRKAIITPGALAVESRHDITPIKAVARGLRWLRMLETGRFATITERAAAENINASYVSRILKLTPLAQEVVEAILDGRQAEGMTLPGLPEGVWGEERELLSPRRVHPADVALGKDLNGMQLSRTDDRQQSNKDSRCRLDPAAE